MMMKSYFQYLTLIFLILHVSVSEGDGSNSAKHMMCFLDASAALQEHEESRFVPEDLDLSICTHVVYSRVEITMDLEIEPKNKSLDFLENGGLGIINRTVALKERKPGLEVFLDLHDSEGELYRNVKAGDRSAMTKFAKTAVHFIQQHGFDGMSIRISSYHEEDPDTEASENLLPIINEEFQKNGLKLITILMPRERPHQTDLTAAMSSYFDLIVVATYWTLPTRYTVIMSSPRNLERVVNGYRDAGIPMEKLVVAIPAFSVTVKLCDRNQRDVNVEYCESGDEGIHAPQTNSLLYSSELIRKMANATEGWAIFKDPESNMLHADSNSLLWTSYEDNTSIRQKVAFVLKNNMAGIAIVNSNMENFKGLYDEEGMTFPITRAAFNALHEEP
ncbi:probable chitinase 10 isoform X2 [Ischnura elegans]|uniref:probable chitinase 10 isoform X2 n=1 Tax=Ischnura elegans TaxID=197161 RepID=UPI001ED89CC6|nr:probable chitinase 10 isoform X2 [Ischnura elegans]